jgi:hypothetical protein
MVGFQRFTRFNKRWQLGGVKFHIGALCLISSIPDSGAFTIRVGHKEAQQLGLLNPRLAD